MLLWTEWLNFLLQWSCIIGRTIHQKHMRNPEPLDHGIITCVAKWDGQVVSDNSPSDSCDGHQHIEILDISVVKDPILLCLPSVSYTYFITKLSIIMPYQQLPLELILHGICFCKNTDFAVHTHTHICTCTAVKRTSIQTLFPLKCFPS